MLLRFVADRWPSELPLIEASRGQLDTGPVVIQDLHAVGAPNNDMDHRSHSRSQAAQRGA